MFGSIRALFEALKQMFSTYQSSIENQLTSDTVREKRDLKKATNITEEILEITDKYISLFEDHDLKHYLKLKRKFLKVN